MGNVMECPICFRKINHKEFELKNGLKKRLVHGDCVFCPHCSSKIMFREVAKIVLQDHFVPVS